MPGRARGIAAVVIGLMLGLTLAACGDDDDGRELSKAEFTSQGNAICSRHIKAIEDAAKAAFVDRDGITVQQAEQFAQRSFIPEVERMREELDNLNPRKNDRGDLRDYVSELGRVLDDEVRHFPVGLVSEEESQNPLREADDLAADAGLTECATLSQRMARAAGPQSANKK